MSATPVGGGLEQTQFALFFEHYFAIAFPIFLVSLWLLVSTILSLLSGWFTLARTFPDDRSESEILRLRGLSGSMGPGVAFSNALTLAVCSGGLRVSVLRFLGPFSKPFFVPWESLTISREQSLFSRSARIQFGHPVVGSLRIAAVTADRLAHAAGGHWPEPGEFPEVPSSARFRRLLGQWAAATTLASLFFIVAPMIAAPAAARPPIIVAILFPAIAFGLMTLLRFAFDRGN